MTPLTLCQEKVFSCIVDFIKERGFPPTVREIASALGFKSINNVRQHLRLIKQKGYLRLVPGKARGIEIAVGLEEEGGGTEVSVPMVGVVPAGRPITAVENIEGKVVLDSDLFKGKGLFTLRVTGDSMRDIGVLDGDIVIVRQQSTANNRDVVVAIIDGEATLKRYIREKDRIILRPENPEYDDIEVPADSSIIIAGKMVGVMRKC